MTDDTTGAGDPLAAQFSPDLLRRLLKPLATMAMPKVFGPGQLMRSSQFAQFPAPDGQVVMLGDSITELGLWQEWFAGQPVLNRGVGAEASGDLLRRLDTAIGRPAGVFLLIGTNDLTSGVPLPEIIGNVRTLLAEVERRAPGTPVVVQSVMPRTPRFREDIRTLNRALRALVDQSGDTVQYLDLWPVLADGDGDLIRSFTEDRLHLNGAGYAAWLEVLRPAVERVLTRAGRVTS